MSDPNNKVIEELDSLAKLVVSGQSGKAQPWQGADVVVTNAIELGNPEVDSFYPSPRFVVTQYVGEVSWLFEKLALIFSNEKTTVLGKKSFLVV